MNHEVIVDRLRQAIQEARKSPSAMVELAARIKVDAEAKRDARAALLLMSRCYEGADLEHSRNRETFLLGYLW